jgi:hypothetical protein
MNPNLERLARETKNEALFVVEKPASKPVNYPDGENVIVFVQDGVLYALDDKDSFLTPVILRHIPEGMHTRRLYYHDNVLLESGFHGKVRNALSHEVLADEGEKAEIRSMCDKDGELYYGVGDELKSVDGKVVWESPSKITSLCNMNGQILAGTFEGGIIVTEYDKHIADYNKNGQYIAGICFRDNVLYHTSLYQVYKSLTLELIDQHPNESFNLFNHNGRLYYDGSDNCIFDAEEPDRKNKLIFYAQSRNPESMMSASCSIPRQFLVVRGFLTEK